MANRFTLPLSQDLDGSGDPYAGGKLYFYETGTSTPLDTYSDSTLSTANANPVVADGNGRFGDIFMKTQDYKVVSKTTADVTIWTADPVSGTATATETKGSDIASRQKQILAGHPVNMWRSREQSQSHPLTQLTRGLGVSSGS